MSIRLYVLSKIKSTYPVDYQTNNLHMSKIYCNFIAENQLLEFSYAEAKIHRQTHRKGTRRTQVYRLQR